MFLKLEIDSLKQSSDKAFKKKHKVRKIMQKANKEIEEFFRYILKREEEKRNNKCEMSFSNEVIANGIFYLQDTYEMNFPIEEVTKDPNYFQNTYISINSFITDLQIYEDSYLSEQDIQVELNTLKKIHQINYSKGATKNKDREKESKILFAYVSIFCGCLLCMIPTPVTQSAGGVLISGGIYVLGENKWTETDIENYQEERKNRYDM